MYKISARQTVYSTGPEGKEKIVAILNHKELHQFILNKVGSELSRVSEVCYYPRVSDIYRELLHWL